MVARAVLIRTAHRADLMPGTAGDRRSRVATVAPRAAVLVATADRPVDRREAMADKVSRRAARQRVARPLKQEKDRLQPLVVHLQVAALEAMAARQVVAKEDMADHRAVAATAVKLNRKSRRAAMADQPV